MTCIWWLAFACLDLPWLLRSGQSEITLAWDPVLVLLFKILLELPCFVFFCTGLIFERFGPFLSVFERFDCLDLVTLVVPLTVLRSYGPTVLSFRFLFSVPLFTFPSHLCVSPRCGSQVFAEPSRLLYPRNSKGLIGNALWPWPHG